MTQGNNVQRNGRYLVAVGLAAGTVFAACSSSGDDGSPPADAAPPESTAAPSTVAPTIASTIAPTTQAPATTIDPAEARTIEQVNEYVAQAAAFDQAGADAQFPQGRRSLPAERPATRATCSTSTPRVWSPHWSRARSTERFAARTRHCPARISS